MKTIFTGFSVLLVFLLCSCGKKSAIVTSDSPDKKVHITVSAEKPVPLDPWRVEISVKAYNVKEGKLKFEITADEVSDKTMEFDWSDDNNCLISIEQADAPARKFQLIADSTQVQMGEVN